MSRGKRDGGPLQRDAAVAYQQDEVNDERDSFFNHRDDSGSVTRVGGVFTTNVQEAAAGRMNSVLNISISSIEQKGKPINPVDVPAESFVGSQSIDWSDEKQEGHMTFDRRKLAKQNLDTSAVASQGSRFDVTSDRNREQRPGLNDSSFPDQFGTVHFENSR